MTFIEEKFCLDIDIEDYVWLSRFSLVLFDFLFTYIIVHYV